MTDNLYVMEIFEDETGEVVSRSKPTSLLCAERMEDGAGINLNWDRFSTRVVPLEVAK